MMGYFLICLVLIVWIAIMAEAYLMLSARLPTAEPEVEEQWIRAEGGRVSVLEPTKEERDMADRNDVA